MYKFILLFIFLGISLHWLYQPFEIDPNDKRIDQYRPSFFKNQSTAPKDSTYALQTNREDKSTAFHFPKAMKLLLSDY